MWEVPLGGSPEHFCAPPDTSHLLLLASGPSWPPGQPQRTHAPPGPFVLLLSYSEQDCQGKQ